MKEFVSTSYWGLFVRGASLPHLVASGREIPDYYKKVKENDKTYKKYQWVVKRCVMGRHLTKREPDAVKSRARKVGSPSRKGSKA